MIAITGNTYPVKDQLRALGGRWNADAKAWMVPEAKADEARALVNSAPKSAPRRSFSRGRSYGGYRCPACGNRADGGPGAPGYMCGEPCGG